MSRYFTMNNILSALFMLGLFAVGAFFTSQYGQVTAESAVPAQSEVIELPADLNEAQRAITEEVEVNTTKALLVIVIGGVVVGALASMGIGMAIVFRLINKEITELPESSG